MINRKVYMNSKLKIVANALEPSGLFASVISDSTVVLS